MKEIAAEVFLALYTVCMAQNLCSELYFSHFCSFYAGIQCSAFRMQYSFDEHDGWRLFW
jgi:hypothetical protein